MSDREGASGVPPIDDELSLPKATVAKMISGACVFCNSFIHGFSLKGSPRFRVLHSRFINHLQSINTRADVCSFSVVHVRWKARVIAERRVLCEGYEGSGD